MAGASWGRSPGPSSGRRNGPRHGPRGDPPRAPHPRARGKTTARRRRAGLVFQDERGGSQRPAVRRPGAPRGETPVLSQACHWKKLAGARAGGGRGEFRRRALFVQTPPGSSNAVPLIAFLSDLKRERRGRRPILIWDGLPSQRSGPRRASLRTPRAGLTGARGPGSAPDLNPVELVGGHVKGRALATRCPAPRGEVEREWRAGLRRVRRSPPLACAVLRQAGLSR